ncbi:MAG: hypothetical protein ACSHWT_13275 [Glaciecola sp.]|jgi:hypothetical protein
MSVCTIKMIKMVSLFAAIWFISIGYASVLVDDNNASAPHTYSLSVTGLTLQSNLDTLYFAYLASGQQDLISVYHDKNRHRVDLYVNYKQPNGYGLSGIATSFYGVLELLKTSSLNQAGEVFIVDAQGVIQLHTDVAITGQQTLAMRYSDAAAEVLLTKHAFNQFESKYQDVQTTQQLMSSFIPSMGWFLVAQINE